MTKTVFISGHLNISKEDWEKHYKSEIDRYIEERCNFVMGDARGVDKMSIDYLWNNWVENVTIYHMYGRPLNNATDYPTKG